MYLAIDRHSKQLTVNLRDEAGVVLVHDLWLGKVRSGARARRALGCALYSTIVRNGTRKPGVLRRKRIVAGIVYLAASLSDRPG